MVVGALSEFLRPLSVCVANWGHDAFGQHISGERAEPKNVQASQAL